MKRFLCLLLLGLGPIQKEGRLYAESFQGKMRQGNKLYVQEKYSEALENYVQAEEKRPKDPRAHFNKGVALYRLEDWDRSSAEFQKSALSNDSMLAAKSFYNMGNSQFKKGKYADAIRSYRGSLKLNPADADAKFNLQLALQIQKNPEKFQRKPQTKNKLGDSKDEQKMKQSAEENQRKEKEETAKRMLKSATDPMNDKPVFKPGSKERKKEYEEDW